MWEWLRSWQCAFPRKLTKASPRRGCGGSSLQYEPWKTSALSRHSSVLSTDVLREEAPSQRHKITRPLRCWGIYGSGRTRRGTALSWPLFSCPGFASGESGKRRQSAPSIFSKRGGGVFLSHEVRRPQRLAQTASLPVWHVLGWLPVRLLRASETLPPRDYLPRRGDGGSVGRLARDSSPGVPMGQLYMAQPQERGRHLLLELLVATTKKSPVMVTGRCLGRGTRSNRYTTTETPHSIGNLVKEGVWG